MYETFFGFQEKPFSLTPQAHHIFLSTTHEPVLQTLLYGVERRVGFMMLSGEVGSGKTTVVRCFLNKIRAQVRTSFVINPLLSTLDLIKTVNRDFGNECHSDSIQDQIDMLNQYLLQVQASHQTAVVVIDEAQNLSFEAFEMARMLSNLETETQKLINIIFVGQPELVEIIHQKRLRQLAQRIQVHAILKPLSQDQTAKYIEHKLSHCGRDIAVRFDPKAIHRIYKRSKGIPRVINAICDMGLLAAYSQSRYVIDKKIIKQALKEVPSYVYYS